MTQDAATDTVTFTFSKMTAAQVVSIPVTISPSVSHAQVLTPLSDTAKAELPVAGNYTLTATVTGTDGTSSSQSAAFSVADTQYSTGTSWTDTTGTLKMSGTYEQGKEYSFSLPGNLTVAYADDSLEHPGWVASKTRVTLAVPAGFTLDAASSPGWTQNGDGIISYDPTVAGASTRFSGTFMAAAGKYTATEAETKASTISGYFGSSSDMQTLTLATPLTVMVVAPAAATAPVLTLSKTKDVAAYIAPDATPTRPGMLDTYDLSYTAAVPATSTENYKDVTLDVQPADGSYLSAGTVTISNPVAGTVIAVNLSSESGLAKVVSYTVTPADTTAKKAIVTIPAAADSGWIEATVTSTLLTAGSYLTADFPKTQAQRTLSSGEAIADGTVKASSATASGTAATSGEYGTVSYVADTASKSVGAKVTYKKTVVINSDLSLQIGVWRSPYHNMGAFVKTLKYDSSGSNLFPSIGGTSVDATLDTTATEIYEPIVYEMLPRKAEMTGTTVKSGIPTPKISSYQTSDGRTVVKFDWTGTGWWLNTRTDTISDVDNPAFSVKWKPAASGVKTTSSAAIWVSNVNDPSVTIKQYNASGGNAIDQPIASDITTEATQGDSGAALIGTYTMTFEPPASYTSFSGAVSVTDNRGVTSSAGTNVLTSSTTADHTLNFNVINASAAAVSNVQMLVNLPTNLHIKPTGAASITGTDSNGAVVSTSDVTVMYSLNEVTPPADSSGLLGTGWLPAVVVNALNKWSEIQSVLISVPTSAAGTEYQVSLPVTDDDARNETKTWGTITATTYADNSPSLTATAKDSYALMEGVKDWDDTNDLAGKRPSSIQVNLLDASGKTVETVKVDQWSAWHYDFTASPVDASGKFINFTVAEAQVPDGYDATSEGLNLTNTLKKLDFVSALPFAGGTGNSYAIFAAGLAGVAVIVGAGAAVTKRRSSKVGA